MQRQQNGEIHHVLCAAFLSKTTFQLCSICQQEGNVVQCTYYKCDKAVHVMCAKKSGFASYDPSYGVQGEALRMALCPQHACFNNTLPDPIKAMVMDITQRDLPKKLFIMRAHKIEVDVAFEEFKEQVFSRVGNMHNMVKSNTKTKPPLPCIYKPKAKAFEWENSIKTAVLSLGNALDK